MSTGWSSDLTTGLRIIDTQHRQYFARVTRLMNACLQEPSAAEVQSAFDFLANYVVHHFGTEERLMAENDYPKASAHLTQHGIFTRQLEAVRAEIEKDGATRSHQVKLNGLLIDWFRNHILTVDRKLTDFIQAKVA